MLQLRNVVVAFLTLSMFTVLPAFPQGNGNAGCKNGKFIGSYTHVDTFPDIWGDGSNVEHQIIQQLNLHSDGTVTNENAGGPDIMLSAGLSTTLVGSWTCRNDGKLVVTVIFAVYGRRQRMRSITLRLSQPHRLWTFSSFNTPGLPTCSR